MRKKRKKKGLNPLVAVGLLVVGAGFAGKMIWGMSQNTPAVPGGAVEIVVDPEVDAQTLPADTPGAVQWCDLLAAHGSFDGRSSVRVAFSILEEARISMPAPIGETGGPVSHWEGEDPPELRLGVVMISSKSRRAVLGGKVVGVGEGQMGVVVQSIERDRVITLWGLKILTYDLQDAFPREFRAERARRQREAAKDEELEVESAVIVDPEARDASWTNPVHRRPGETRQTRKGQEKGK